jgi:hypothetical protein
MSRTLRMESPFFSSINIAMIALKYGCFSSDCVRFERSPQWNNGVVFQVLLKFRSM